MALVYDRHEEATKPLHDHLRNNKMFFEQFLRTVNFVREISKDGLDVYTEAYKNGKFRNHGRY